MPNSALSPLWQKINALWRYLTTPPDDVKEVETRTNIYALSGLMLALLLLICSLGTIVGIFSYFDKGQISSLLAPMFAGSCFLGTYLLSRRGYVHQAAVLGVITSSVIILTNVILNTQGTARATFYYLSVPLVFSTVFLPARFTALTAVIHLVGIFVAWALGIPFAENSIVDIAGFYVIFSSTVTLITIYSKRIEAQRRKELTESQMGFRRLLEAANEAITQISVKGQLIYVNRRFAEMLGYQAQEVLGHHYTEFLHPDAVAEAQKGFAEWLRGVRGRRDLLFRHKNGSAIWMLASSAGIFSGEGILLLLTDITDRKAAETSDQEARRVAEAFNEIGAALTSTLELDELLNRIVTGINKMIPHDASEIMLVKGDYVRVVRHRNHIDHEHDNKLQGVLWRLGDVRNLTELSTGDKKVLFANIKEYEGWLHIAGYEWAESFCTAPICLDDEVIGFITLTSQTRDFFNDDYAARLIAFANYAAVAIQNAQLYEQAYELAVTRERQRLARELHDAVTQTLFAASIMAESLPRLWDTNPTWVRERLVDLERLTRGALAEMRTSIFEMRPETITETEFSRLLTSLADTVLSKSQMHVALQMEGTLPLLPNVQFVFYRVAQEALNNIVKHSNASRIDILYANGEQEVSLTISDNGDGFEPDAVISDHFGLKIMRERAESVGAELRVTSQPTQGTQIKLHWARRDIPIDELMSPNEHKAK